MNRPLVAACALAFAPLVFAQTPPSIPHPTDGYLVTKQENNCLECHDKPRDIGKKRGKAQPTPAPTSHYESLAGKPAIDSSHFACDTCHKLK
jgi:nitrate reductase cytochrome c-type subunit